ncbi:MAG: hypothetical protein ACRCWM_11340 [Sarcina sp.]
MKTNFVDACYTNNNYLYIKFNRQMQLNGSHSILNTSNYLLKNSKQSLFHIVSKIFCYSTTFISFELKKNIIIPPNEILCFGHISQSDIFFLTDINNYVHDIACSTPIKLYSEHPSITNCTAKIYSNKSLILYDKNTIPLNKLNLKDFYIKKNDINFYPSNIKKNIDESFTLFFNTEIAKRNSDIITLFTSSKCYTTNLLGLTLLSNESINVKVSLPCTPINLSIFSYIDDVLGVALDFSDAILRYDSNDFYFTINGKRCNAKGRQSHYKDNIIYFFLYDIFDFDYNSNKLSIVYKNPKTPYTLGKNLTPIYMPYRISSNILHAISGTLDNIVDIKTGILNVEFSNHLLPQQLTTKSFFDTFINLKYTLFSKAITKYMPILDLDDETPIFYISDFGFIIFYLTENISNIPSYEYDIKVALTDNNFVAEIPLLSKNFFDILKNKTDYIEFIPLTNIRSCNYTSPISTLEAPIELLINDSCELIFYPNEQNKFETLLGTTVLCSTTILVDKTFSQYTYGDSSANQRIIFSEALYIKSVASTINFEKPTIDVFNIQGTTLYVSLDDNYYINFNNCHFEDVIIL